MQNADDLIAHVSEQVGRHVIPQIQTGEYKKYSFKVEFYGRENTNGIETNGVEIQYIQFIPGHPKRLTKTEEKIFACGELVIDDEVFINRGDAE